jgi:hypothetical protein
MSKTTSTEDTRLVPANSIEQWYCGWCGCSWELTASQAAKGCPLDWPDACERKLARRVTVWPEAVDPRGAQ